MKNQVKAIVGGFLIDGTGRAPIRNSVILIEGSKIIDVGDTKEVKVPTGCQAIDAKGKVVMPGLIDAHVHLAGIVDPTEPNATLAMLKTPSALLVLHAFNHAKEMFDTGFTTIRDMSGQTNAPNIEMISLRKAIEIGIVPGPRIVVCGWIGQTGGHLDLGLPATIPRNPWDTADGVWEVRKRVREFIRGGVDCIKTSAGGGGTREGEEPWWRNYTSEELTSICDEAHAVGKRVATHSYVADNTKRAINAGSDTIEHGLPLDDEVIELMLKNRTILVPTIFTFSEECVLGIERVWGRTGPALQRYRELSKDARADFKKCHKAGVKMAAGSDIYRTLRDFYGRNAIELEFMVKNGMTEMEAIVAGTKVGAEALGLEDKVGTIAEGKIADMIFVEGDPLKDIRILQDKTKIKVVMKGGEIAVDRR